MKNLRYVAFSLVVLIGATGESFGATGKLSKRAKELKSSIQVLDNGSLESQYNANFQLMSRPSDKDHLKSLQVNHDIYSMEFARRQAGDAADAARLAGEAAEPAVAVSRADEAALAAAARVKEAAKIVPEPDLISGDGLMAGTTVVPLSSIPVLTQVPLAAGLNTPTTDQRPALMREISAFGKGKSAPAVSATAEAASAAKAARAAARAAESSSFKPTAEHLEIGQLAAATKIKQLGPENYERLDAAQRLAGNMVDRYSTALAKKPGDTDLQLSLGSAMAEHRALSKHLKADEKALAAMSPEQRTVELAGRADTVKAKADAAAAAKTAARDAALAEAIQAQAAREERIMADNRAADAAHKDQLAKEQAAAAKDKAEARLRETNTAEAAAKLAKLTAESAAGVLGIKEALARQAAEAKANADAVKANAGTVAAAARVAAAAEAAAARVAVEVAQAKIVTAALATVPKTQNGIMAFLKNLEPKRMRIARQLRALNKKGGGVMNSSQMVEKNALLAERDKLGTIRAGATRMLATMKNSLGMNRTQKQSATATGVVAAVAPAVVK